MGDLFEDYAAGPAWDEMFDPTGGLRPGYAVLHELLAALGVDDLAERGALRDRALRDQGITFTLSGEERPKRAMKRPSPEAIRRSVFVRECWI